MTNEQFWNIADIFEAIDKNDQPYVPMRNVKELSEAILEANKGDIDESLADFDLFNYKRENKAKKIFNKVVKKYLQNK